MSPERPEERTEDVVPGRGAEEEPTIPHRAGGEGEPDRREDEGWSQPESSAQKGAESPEEP